MDGEWISGNPPLIGPTSHAMWLGSTVFDGARWFDGIAPDLDLHSQRINRSAEALGMKATVAAEEIEAYVATGEPLDKAGGYAVQGRAAAFIEAVRGSFSGVVGLPLCTLAQLAKRAGVDLYDSHGAGPACG